MKKILTIASILTLFMSCGNNNERTRDYSHLKDSIAHYREKGKELRKSSKFACRCACSGCRARRTRTSF